MYLKIKNVHIAILLFFLPVSLSAQITFERWYGPNLTYASGRSVFQKGDGGYVFAGAMNYEFYLVRTDSLGDTLWTKIFPGIRWDHCYSMDTTSDGGYIMAGATKSFGVDSINVYVIRTDSFGDTLWTRSYGGPFEDVGFSIKQIPDGGFIIAGRTNSYGAGGFDAYLIRINSFGDTLWTRTYGDSLINIAGCVEIAPDNNFVLAGRTETPTSGVRAFLTKVDTLGNVIWTKLYGSAWTEAHSIRNTIDSGFIITGQTPAPPATYDVYLLKTDSLGDSLWSKKIGLRTGSSDERNVGYSVEQTSDSGYIITGYYRAYSSTDSDLFLVRTNEFGDTLWTKLYRPVSGASETGYSVRQTKDGGYIISGRYNGGGHGQAYLIKTDTLGNVGVEEKRKRRKISTPLILTCSPNPFSQTMTIRYGISNNSPNAGMLLKHGNSRSVNLKIYDIAGRMIKTLVEGTQKGGVYRITWDGSNDLGRAVPSGVYFARLTYGDFTASKKLVFLK